MEYDLLVIGAGSGGVRAARMAAQAGKRVALVEYQALGGTCVNVGCIPKKLLVYASLVKEYVDDAGGYGWDYGEAQFSWQSLIENKNREIKRLNGIYANLLENAGVTLIEGRASFVDAHTVSVNGFSYSSERILVCTGSSSFVPDFPGNEWVDSSSDMFYLEKLPEKILIVGGGYIALEFASIFQGLGVEVHLVYRGELFLRGFDKDVRQFLYRQMLAKGIHIQFEQDVSCIEKNDDGLLVSFSDKSEASFERVLYATGRRPNTEALGLDSIGVDMDERGAITVDDCFQSSVPSIYALGDVIDRFQLTPVAIEEAMVLVNHLYGDNTKRMDYHLIPSAVFSLPHMACVGLSEEQAQAKALEEGFDIDVYESEFRALKLTLTENPERTYLKLIVNRQSDEVLGVHMVGEHAEEVIQGLAVALKAGATKRDFDATVGIHPSSAEEFVTMRNARA